MIKKSNCYCYSHLLSMYEIIPAYSQGTLGRSDSTRARTLPDTILVGLEHKIKNRMKTEERKLRQKPGHYGLGQNDWGREINPINYVHQDLPTVVCLIVILKTVSLERYYFQFYPVKLRFKEIKRLNLHKVTQLKVQEQGFEPRSVRP